MMKYIIQLMAWASLTVGAASAQVVTGTVSDPSGPLIGATVLVKGTNQGTVTNNEGKFSLTVSDPKHAVLVCKSIGMEEQEFPLKGKTHNVAILLSHAITSLNDLVVVGYGTQRRRDVTGSIASVAGKALEKIPVSNLGQALVGKLAGVQVTAVDGSPDPEIMIRVRGGTSITQDNSPLFIIDGFQMGDINSIPITDIESVDVLKDAAATAIYGARGANGVVIITTKSGTKGKTLVSFNSYVQTASLTRKLNMMNPYEFVMIQYENELLQTSTPLNVPKNFGDPDDYYLYKNEKGHDWQEDILGKEVLAQFYNLSVSGGGDKTVYSFNFNHSNTPGQLVGSGFEKTNFNLKLNTDLSEHFKLEYNARYQNKVSLGKGTNGVNIINALEYKPTMGLGDFTYIPEDDEAYDEEDNKIYQLYKPSEEAKQNYRKKIATDFVTTGALTWNIIDPLKFRTELAISDARVNEDDFYGPLSGKANDIGNNGMPVVETGRAVSNRYSFRNVLTYNAKLRHSQYLNVILGHEMSGGKSSSNFSSARFFPVDISMEKALANTQLGTPFSNSSTISDMNYVTSDFSFFGRGAYDFDHKYYFTLTLRADGSSVFAPGKRWGFFPAAAAAWRISDEDFMKDSRVISDLKFRLSYGLSGNNRISSNLWRKTYSINAYDTYGFMEQSNPYYYQSSKYLPNPNLKWETTISRNAGFDFGFLKDRVNGTLDLYWNTTKDLLVPSKIPNTSGFEEQQTNIGQTSNRGIELFLNTYIIERNDLSLNVTFNIGFNKSRIDKLASGEDIWYMTSGITGELISLDDYRLQVGKTLGLIMGYVNDGFYSVDDFSFDPQSGRYTLLPGIADSRMLSGTPRPGNAKFKKLTPVNKDDPNTYILTADDRKVIGNTNPKFSGGMAFNVAWKGFDVMAFFNYMYGFDVYNVNKIHITSFWRNSLQNISADMNMDKRFRYVNDQGVNLLKNPDALRDLNQDASIWSPLSITKPIVMKYVIEDGSFLRLNTLSLGYTLPSSLTQKVKISKLRVYVTGYNLVLWTKYSGYDPEVNVQNGLFPGMDNNMYPRNLTRTAGVNVTF